VSIATLMRQVLEEEQKKTFPKPRGGVSSSGGKGLGRLSGDEMPEPTAWRS
jgi:hypothetical protein